MRTITHPAQATCEHTEGQACGLHLPAISKRSLIPTLIYLLLCTSMWFHAVPCIEQTVMQMHAQVGWPLSEELLCE